MWPQGGNRRITYLGEDLEEEEKIESNTEDEEYNKSGERKIKEEKEGLTS